MIRISALESLELLKASQRRVERAAERVLSIVESRRPVGEVRRMPRREG